MQSALGLLEFKLNSLVGLQGLATGHFNSPEVHEDFAVLTVRDNESITLGIREPFASTGIHKNILKTKATTKETIHFCPLSNFIIDLLWQVGRLFLTLRYLRKI